MNEKDNKFLVMVKLKMDRVFILERALVVKDKTPHNIDEFENILRDLNCDVLTCLQSIRVREIKTAIDIYNEVLKCWIDDLHSLIELTSPSENLKEFMYTYVERFRIAEVLDAIREVSTDRLDGKHYVLTDINALNLTPSRTVREFLEDLKSLYPRTYKILSKVLMNYINSPLKELNLEVIEENVWRSLWSLLSSMTLKLRPHIKLHLVVNHLRDMELLELLMRRAYLKGEDLSTYLSGKKPLITNIISQVIQRSPIDFDTALHIIKYAYSINELRYSPLSYDKALEYLLAKEWEAHIVSHLIYILDNLGSEYLVKSIVSWWSWYEHVIKGT